MGSDPTWLSWRSWFDRLDIRLPADHQGPTFNNYVILMQAAQGGQGIALGWRRLVEPMIENGALVRPIAASLRSEDAYHLVMARDKSLSAEAESFRDWLRAEAAACDHGPTPS